MNFTPAQKAWILLVALIFSTAAGIFVTAYTGGAKWWIALILALGTAGTNVYHALAKSPSDAGQSTPTKDAP